jgi:hypothetical protein
VKKGLARVGNWKGEHLKTRIFVIIVILAIGVLLFSSIWTSSLYGAAKKLVSKSSTKKSVSKSSTTKDSVVNSSATDRSPGKRPIILKTSDEDLAISLLARTFERMGEGKLAKRLITDYTQTKRVVFEDLGDVNAETGRNWRGEKYNDA